MISKLFRKWCNGSLVYLTKMYRQPKTFLGVTRRDGYVHENITRIELQYGISVGVVLRSSSEEMVPFYEEHAARLERGISLENWASMPVMEKALLIAHRRISISMKNLQTEAEIKESERKA